MAASQAGKPEQVAAVSGPVTNAAPGHGIAQSKQSTGTKPVAEREIDVSLLAANQAPLDQSDLNAMDQSYVEGESLIRIDGNHTAQQNIPSFAQTYTKTSDQPFNLSQFMDRKASLRSPQAAHDQQFRKQMHLQPDIPKSKGGSKNSSK